MSTYDRRTWQRPAGERTADPLWVEDIQDATGRRGRYRTPAVMGHGDCPIAGNLSNQYKALAPRRDSSKDE